jgi:hypothetical protein
MYKDIQQAESAIQAGDTKTGFEILREYLAENPDSERAWWVMSGLVQRDERATCLEQVLRINPDNQLARETLEKLYTSPPETELKPPRDLPGQERDRIELGYPVQAFLFKKGSRIYMTLLDGLQIIQAYTSRVDLPIVRDAVTKGQFPEEYLSDIKSIPQDSIQAVKQAGSALIVQYRDGPIGKSLRLPFDDEEKARAVLSVLTTKLGPNYMIQSKSSNNAFRLVFSSLLTLGSAAFVAAILWTLPQVGAGQGGESWRTQMVSRLLESLGYVGVVLICVAFILAALGLSAYLLLKPPVRAELGRRD